MFIAIYTDTWLRSMHESSMRAILCSHNAVMHNHKQVCRQCQDAKHIRGVRFGTWSPRHAPLHHQCLCPKSGHLDATPRCCMLSQLLGLSTAETARCQHCHIATVCCKVGLIFAKQQDVRIAIFATNTSQGFTPMVHSCGQTA